MRILGAADALQQSETIQAGHGQVGEYHLDARLGEQPFPAVFAIDALQEGEVLGQDLLDRMTHQARVIDDQNDRLISALNCFG